MASDDSRLLGTWRTDPNDHPSLQEYGDVSLCFEAGGKLLYTVHLPNKQQIMRLSYRVEGRFLVTDQLSAPREERTGFLFTADGRLALENPPPAAPTYYVQVRR